MPPLEAATPDDLPVVVAGGGIGGLATALALARRGIRASVHERRSAPDEAGAGIQIGPNGTRILHDLGVAGDLEAVAGRPDSLSVRDGASGRQLARLPLGPWLAARHGSPYWVLHRPDLHRALLSRARRSPLITIATGSEITAITDGVGPVLVQAADGNQHAARALIAADGLWSRLRGGISDTPAPTYAGKSAARTVVETERLPDGFWRQAVGIWLSPRGHVVHYPVRGGGELAIVVVAPETAGGEGWAEPVTAAWVERQTATFAAELRGLLAVATQWRRWSLVETPTPRSWVRGRAALLGDAAHPVLPFLAQGAVLALEDAAVLADELARSPSDVPAALHAYQRRRVGRARQVVAASRRNGIIYHLGAVAGTARNLALSLFPPEQLMARYDWLYGWRADAEG